MILSDTQNAEAIPLAERCRQSIADQPFTTSAGDISVTVSIGIAELDLTDDTATRSQLIEAADQKLYQAKEVWPQPGLQLIALVINSHEHKSMQRLVGHSLPEVTKRLSLNQTWQVS